MKDRLDELKNRLDEEELEEDEEDSSVVVTIDQDEMKSFFLMVDEIKKLIDLIQKAIDEVKKKHSDILSAPQAENRTKEELETCMKNIKDNAQKVRNRLKQIQREIEENNTLSAASIRIQQTQHSTLSRNFIAAMTLYNDTQNDYRDRCKQRIQRQLEITGRTVTDTQIEEILDSKTVDNQMIFAGGIVMNDTSKEAFTDIQARHQDIVKLETSIRELHDMFMDMAMLVEQQGEMINRIEFNVNNAADYTEAAKENLKEAVVYQKKARKGEMVDRIEHNVDNSVDYVERAVSDTKKAVKYQSQARRKTIILVVIVVVVLLVIVAIVLGTQLPKSS